MSSHSRVCLDALLWAIREHMLENNNDVQASTAAILSQRLQRSDTGHTFLLNTSLIDDTEEQIFDSLIAFPEFTTIWLRPELDASDALSMLRSALSGMPNLLSVGIGLEMTQVQAESLFSMLGTYNSLKRVIVSFGYSPESLYNPLAKLLRDSPRMRVFQWSWAKYDEPNNPVSIPESAMKSICEGIANSTSLRFLAMHDAPAENDADKTATLLANAAMRCSSVIMILLTQRQGFDTLISKALKRTTPIQNFDMSFCRWGDQLGGSRPTFRILRRIVKWKELLSQNVPLALWPLILAKANTWNKQESHSPEDALFFLLKEKNDVLMQNVRRRKIRKRKRFQFE